MPQILFMKMTKKYRKKYISYSLWGKQAYLPTNEVNEIALIHCSKWYVNILTWNFSSSVLLAG